MITPERVRQIEQWLHRAPEAYAVSEITGLDELMQTLAALPSPQLTELFDALSIALPSNQPQRILGGKDEGMGRLMRLREWLQIRRRKAIKGES